MQNVYNLFYILYFVCANINIRKNPIHLHVFKELLFNLESQQILCNKSIFLPFSKSGNAFFHFYDQIIMSHGTLEVVAEEKREVL